MSEYINNIIYGVKSFITGMSLTLKHFRNKKDLVATLQYPNEKWPLPERNIGFDPSEYNVIRSRLHVDIDDCIGCLQCERACPVDCIKIDTIKPPKGSDFDCGKTSHDTQKKMIVPRFTIDMSECMYCDLCVHPCPEECIYMVGGPNEVKHEIDYEFSQYERHGLVFEFATSTEQDIIDIGGEDYLKERKAKEEKRAKGESLKGIVATENTDDSTTSDEEPKKSQHKDPLLEIFNIVPDKVARGIAKKAVVFGKRSQFDFPAMAKEVENRISKAGKASSEMTDALETLKNYVVKDESAPSNEPNEEVSVSTDSVPSTASSSIDFTIKSIDFIEDKAVRGTAKKAFMGAKRAKLEGAAMIDFIISELDKIGKLDDGTKSTLEGFKESVSTVNAESGDAVDSVDTSIDFTIKSIDFIEDRAVRGTAKKAFMGAKRAKLEGAEMIDFIITELDKASKLDDETKSTLEGFKGGKN